MRVVTLIGPVLITALPAQATWIRLVPATSPAARVGHAVAYDEARQQTVLFGGTDHRQSLSGTWVWNGANWTLLNPPVSPPVKTDHAMVYDAARREVVLFGGTGGSAETWVWNGSAWTKKQPSVSPSGRESFGLAYDSKRKRVVLFGGHGSGVGTYLGDTWEWDGTSWLLRNPTVSPPRRHRHSMAYDSARGRTVVFGGYNSTQGYLNDTWVWDGQNWSRAASTSAPPSRTGSAMVFDSFLERVVVFGGQSATSSQLADTWEWDGTSWVQISAPASPSARQHHAMCYDSHRKRVVMFGGAAASNYADTWEYRGLVTATFTTLGVGCGSPIATLAAFAGSRPVLGRPFTMVASNLPTSSGLMTAGVSKDRMGGVLLPLRLDLFGFRGCWLYQSLDATWGFPVTSGTGLFSGIVPTVPGLVGERLYFQAAAGSVVTNGGEVRIGNQ